jgi:hypothetical protein
MGPCFFLILLKANILYPDRIWSSDAPTNADGDDATRPHNHGNRTQGECNFNYFGQFLYIFGGKIGVFFKKQVYDLIFA